ncbi:MAG TPA: FAD-dependent oxidoreductase, partial [Gaiellales bacterium]|nr:FAD-dependent oxidoreductase [Gaiellales bacterium]
MNHPRAVVVGAGPAGFYTADQLLKAGFGVDMLDRLPTPFGLVRAGVAPDHPNIKSVIRVYERIATTPGFRFFGGVELGRELSRSDLLERYHGVVYATGSSDDNRLGIPGEDRPGSHAATHFVAWYNGHPDAADHEYDLSPARAVVIGNGNVALDVARMLVLHPDELRPTDTADHAIAALERSGVREVVVLGRRGPVQAAFTNPELRELIDLQRAGVVVEDEELALDPRSAAYLADGADATARRNVEILRDYAQRGPKPGSHRIVLRFLCSPVEILGEGEHGAVTGVRVARNRIEPDQHGNLRAVATDRHELIDCGLVLRSIGYRGRRVDDVPFDPRRGLIRNQGGRVVAEDGSRLPGEYVVGWIKRGPSGVIGTNKKDAADTVARILEDVAAAALNVPLDPDPAAAEALIAARAPDAVTWQGWQAIDAHAKAAGAPHGRPR